MFIRSGTKYVNLDHVATGEVIESRGNRAVKLLAANGHELGVVREADFEAFVLSQEQNR